jgi:hypothetical protein
MSDAVAIADAACSPKSGLSEETAAKSGSTPAESLALLGDERRLVDHRLDDRFFISQLGVTLANPFFTDSNMSLPLSSSDGGGGGATCPAWSMLYIMFLIFGWLLFGGMVGSVDLSD